MGKTPVLGKDANLPMFPTLMSKPKFEQAAAYAVDVWTKELSKQENAKALAPLTFPDVWWVYERIQEEEKKAAIVEEKQKMDALSTPHAHACNAYASSTSIAPRHPKC